MAHGIAFSLVPHQLWNFWHTGPSDSTSFSWTASVLILSLVGLAWSLSRKSSTRPRTSIGTNGIAPVCPPEQLKDDLKGGVANAYALERELTVPFDVGDVRVSKILMHPIKMVLITPKVEVDVASPYGGRLTVSFPADSDCETFSVPLNPTDDLLASWPVIEECRMFGVYLVEGYVVSSTLDGPGSRTPSEILSDYFGRAVYLVMKGHRPRECPPTQAFPKLQETAKFQDGYPFLVASEESLEEVRRVVSAFAQDESPEAKIGGIDRERWRDGGVEIERFRPNIVFKGSGVPFAEDMWRRVRIHPSESESMDASADEARTFTLVSKCTRCLLPNVDITTGARDAAVPYKVLLKFRRNKDPARMSKPCFGCNAVVGGTGVVRVGDRVEVLEWAGGIGV
ncbi:hypothetical protein ONZ51_g12296 [Trametes cubensis]|uniref:MOSC domain-containing protein n=1 Tax=Trametes cubensis TaxID=1111947 RepID=A0AAD7TFZ1_9APHY|nr:hypothetical protein ONZ51_g12296 [Trametes cubensis]